MSPITTHVLDTSSGKPAKGIEVTLEAFAEKWQEVGRGRTDSDGRIKDLLEPGALAPGKYRLVFRAKAYLEKAGGGFYEDIPIEFTVVNVDQHYHVPLLLSPFGYSTYRGS